MTDVIAREPWLAAPWDRPVLPASQRPIPRVDIDVEIDRRWHLAKFCEDPQAAAEHWRRHNELVQQRAAQQQGAAQP